MLSEWVGRSYGIRSVASPTCQAADLTGFFTLTEEGPIYDTVGLDAERDEFAVKFSEGCIEFDTAKLNWLILTSEHPAVLQELLEEAERARELWCSSPADNDFEIFHDPVSGDEAANAIREKYK